MFVDGTLELALRGSPRATAVPRQSPSRSKPRDKVDHCKSSGIRVAASSACLEPSLSDVHFE